MHKSLSRLIKKRREDQNYQNQKQKRRDYNWYHRNSKDCKKLLRATICQEIDNLGEMNKFLENIWPYKTEWKKQQLEDTVNSWWNQISNQKTPITQMPWTEQFHGRISQIIEGGANAYPSQTITKKNLMRGKTPKLLFMKTASS